MAPELIPNSAPPSLQRGLLLLDIDDVLCLSQPFGAYHALAALLRPADEPEEIWEKLFHPKAVAALQTLMLECQPQVALTTSWLAVMGRQHFVEIFRRTGLKAVAESLHENWKAASNPDATRHEAISSWLAENHHGEPVLILDDVISGEGLVDSEWHVAGHQILCEVDRGFHAGLLSMAIKALRSPYVKPAWW